MTVAPGDDESAAHPDDERAADTDPTPAEQQPTGAGPLMTPAGGGPEGPSWSGESSWRSDPSDDAVDAAFAAIVSGFAAEARWSNLADAGPEAGAQRHPSAGGRTTDTGAERARRRELRRLERAEEVAAYAAEQAQIEAERAADEAHFEPPEPPPLPKPKGRTVGAVLLVAAGIALLARPGLLAVSADLALILAVLCIVGGVTLLLTGIWQRRHSQDADGDDGAVV